MNGANRHGFTQVSEGGELISQGKWRGAVGWWPTFSPIKSMSYLAACRDESRRFLAIIVQQLPQDPFGIAEKGTHDPVVLGLFRTNGEDDVTVQGYQTPAACAAKLKAIGQPPSLRGSEPGSITGTSSKALLAAV